jgi:hypothetical protein
MSNNSLDNSHSDLWTRKEIKHDKVILEKWWHQLGHNWTHYCKVVPWMMFLQGKQHTWFAGSWTLVLHSLKKSLSIIFQLPDLITHCFERAHALGYNFHSYYIISVDDGSAIS